MLRSFRSSPLIPSVRSIMTSPSTSSTLTPFPSYLLHSPFLSVSSPLTPSPQLLQRTLPPSPLYYLHPAPSFPPGSAPPSLLLTSPSDPIQGTRSQIYRATSPSGTKVILKYSQDFLSLLKEAEEVFVNLPQGGALPIPTYYGIFQGNVVEGQGNGMVTVLEDRGDPLPNESFEDLTLKERRFLFETLKTLHDIHFSHGSFSPASVVVSSPSSAPSSSTLTTTATSRATQESTEERKLTLVGFSQAQWHLCEGENSCKELLEAKQALGL
ncbi:uncharacterized protein JCM6883_006741 [Sporobolomyces salmoneus]|uniref:uncharacterized protein n=1 Tax=Sporobolomyces salmoneus TaxID=183962 RepID=UPI0031785289